MVFRHSVDQTRFLFVLSVLSPESPTPVIAQAKTTKLS